MRSGLALADRDPSSPRRDFLSRDPPATKGFLAAHPMDQAFAKPVIPTSSDTLNWYTRILSALMWLGSSLWLILRFVPTTATRILVCLPVGTPGYQFIQPTIELFAGSLFALFLFSTSQRWPHARPFSVSAPIHWVHSQHLPLQKLVCTHFVSSPFEESSSPPAKAIG